MTIPRTVQNEAGADVFVRYLLSDAGRAVLAKHGFVPADVLVAGDPSAVPPSLRDLVQGPYQP
ncbi:MAG: hypothetical protein ACR2PL_26195 [Dehalococcoidia bacterium]